MTDKIGGADLAVQAPSAVNTASSVLTAYNQLFASANILSVSLLRSKSDFRPERLNQGIEQLQLSVPAPEYRAGFDQNSGTVQCGVRLRAFVGPNSNIENAAATIEAEYLIHYGVPVGMQVPEEVMKIFAFRNGVFHAWSFFRELVFSMVGRMNMQPLVIPLFKLPTLPPSQ